MSGQRITQVFRADGSWTFPAGVTSVACVATGQGGGGGGSAAAGSGGGGAGGQCVAGTLSGSPGDVLTVAVGTSGGAGGAGAADGAAGADTTINGTAVVAKGGAGGLSLANGATKSSGSTAGGVGGTVRKGGDGASGGSSTTGGAGGGAAGSTADGPAASGVTPGGYANAWGGHGGAGKTSSGDGAAAPASDAFVTYRLDWQFGGGGSGGYNSSGTTSRTGGAGRQGVVALSWDAPDSPYLDENFDGLTPPALPAGWQVTGGGGLAAVSSNLKSYTAAKSLRFSGLSGSWGYAWHPYALDGALGQVQIEASFSPSAITSGQTNTFALYGRCLGAPSGATPPPYSVEFYGDLAGAAPSGAWELNVITSSGTRSNVTFTGTQPPAALFSAAEWYRVILTLKDTPSGLNTEAAGYVQRASDGAWLLPGNTWQAGSQTAFLSGLISTNTSPQYDVRWSTGTFAAVGCNLASGQVLYCDSVKLSALPTGQGALPASAPAPAADEVELIPAAVTAVDAGVASHGTDQLNLAGYASYYLSTATKASYVQLDAGSGNSVAPCALLHAVGFAQASSVGVEELVIGSLLDGAASSSGPWTNLGQIAADSFARPNLLTTLRLDHAAGSYRYFRLRTPLHACCWSQFRVVVRWAVGVSWRPCRPTLSPAAGRFAAGQVVSITTTTGTINGTATSIYYTTDGTTPTTSSTLYSGPFAIPSNAPGKTVIKAIAYNSGATTTTSEVTTGQYTVARKIVPDTGSTGNTIFGNGSAARWPDDWHDSEGNLIDANSGGVVFDPEDSTYNLIGGITNCQPTDGTPTRGFNGYKSALAQGQPLDYFNWQRVGQVIPPPPTAWVKNAGYVGSTPFWTRAHFLINPAPLDAARRYVCWAHFADSAGAAVCVTAPALAGPWRFQYFWRPGTTVGDMTVFYDVADDGTGNSRNKAWLTCAADNNAGVAIVQLDPLTDWTSFTGTTIKFTTGRSEEAPAMFYYGGYYYRISSQTLPYGGSGGGALQYVSATTIAGLASATPHSIWASTPATPNANFYVQSTHVFAVPGLTAPGFILMCDAQDPGDAASPINLQNARMAWYPLSSVAGGNKSNAFPSAGTLSVAAPTSWDTSYLPDPVAAPLRPGVRTGGALGGAGLLTGGGM